MRVLVEEGKKIDKERERPKGRKNEREREGENVCSFRRLGRQKDERESEREKRTLWFLK